MGLKEELQRIDSEVLADQTLVALTIETGIIPDPKEVVEGNRDYQVFTEVLRAFQGDWPEERILGAWLAFEGLARVAEIQKRK